MAVFGGGGGNNVATADICEEEGIELPPPTPETRGRLLEFVTLVNQSVVNPMDAGSLFGDMGRLNRALQIMASDPRTDVMMLHLGADFGKWLSTRGMADLKSTVLSFNREDPSGKPLVVAVQEQEKPAEAAEFIHELRQSGITAFASLRRACRVFRRLAVYRRFLRETA